MGPVKKFGRKLKSETFSFISLLISLSVLFGNYITEKLIPIMPKVLPGVPMMQAFGMSISFLSFSAGFALLAIASLYIFLYPENVKI